MRVIFLKDVRGIGKKSETKEVNDGYARNFLIPRGFAKMAFERDVKEIERKREEEKINHEKRIQKFIALSDEFKKNPIVFKLKKGAKGEIFGSVSAKDIIEKIKKRGVEDIKINTEKPIKKIGLHEVETDFGSGIKIKFLIEIQSED